MFKCCLLFGSGIWLGSKLGLPLILWWAATLTCVILFLVARPWRPQALGCLLVVSGATIHAVNTYPLHPGDLRHLPLGMGMHGRLSGKLISSPSLGANPQASGGATWFEVDVEASHWSYLHEKQPAHGKVRVKSQGRPDPSLQPGVMIEVTGVLQTPAIPWSQSLFDQRSYLRHQGIHTVLQVDATADWQCVASQKGLWERFINSLRKRAQERLALGMPQIEPIHLLREAMALGTQSEHKDRLMAAFELTGTRHLFAISGLHVTLVGGMMVGLLRLCRLPSGPAYLIAITALWLYTVISGLQVSAIRASTMMTLLLLGLSLGRPVQHLNSLYAAAFIVLAWDSHQLFQLGFQLSFAVVTSLLALTSPIRLRLLKWFRPDPWLPPRLYHRRQALRARLASPVSTALAVSVAAWLGSFPLIWSAMGLITPLALLLNPLLLPLAACVMACAMGSLLTPWGMESIAELLNHSGWFWMALIQALCEAAAELDWAYARLAPLKAPMVVTLYAGLLLGLWEGLARPWYRITLHTCWILACLWIVEAGYHRHGSLQLNILPMAGGDAICMRPPGSAAFDLIDGGSDFWMRQTTERFLRARGIHSLHTWWISHGDADHIGGGAAILEGWHPKRVKVASNQYKSPYFLALKKQLKAMNIPMELGADATHGPTVQLLHPPEDRLFTRADDGNGVWLLTQGPFKILLLGDLSREGMRELANQHPQLKVQVVVLNRPSEEVTANGYWLSSLDPWVLIISGIPAGREDSWVNHLETMPALDQAKILSTGRSGAITLNITQETLRVEQGLGPTLQWRGSDHPHPQKASP